MCCANRNVSYQLKRYHACFLQEILTLRGIIMDCRITFYDYIIFCLHLIFYDLAIYMYIFILLSKYCLLYVLAFTFPGRHGTA